MKKKLEMKFFWTKKFREEVYLKKINNEMCYVCLYKVIINFMILIRLYTYLRLF